MPSLVILIIGAIILLLGALGGIASDRMLMRQVEGQAIRAQFAFRLQETTRALRHVANTFSASGDIAQSYRADRTQDLTHAAQALVNQARSKDGVSRITLLDPELKPIFGSGAASPPAAALVMEAARQSQPIWSLETEREGVVLLTVAMPWTIDGGRIGFVVAEAPLDALLFDFGREAHLAVLPLEKGVVASDERRALAETLLRKLANVGPADADRIALAFQQRKRGSLSTTVALNDRPCDLIELPLPPGIGAQVTFVAIHDASEREALLSNRLLRFVLVWFICIAMFAGASLWLALGLSRAFERASREGLREREERVSAVMDAVVDGIVTMDSGGLIRSFNPAAETIFGIPAREAIGQNVSILMPSGLATQHQSYVNRYLTTGQRHIIGVKREVTGRRKDGTEFPMDLAISQSSVGGEVLFIGVMRDVTDRKTANDLLLETLRQQKAAQQALRRRSDELVRAAKALTRARDKAEAANEAKSRFLASMSHELRTPMNGILGMTDILLRSALSGEQEKWAKMIRESGQALLALLNDILDLSKIEEGRFEIRTATFDAVGLTRQLAISWEHQVREKGLQLTVEAPAEPLLVKADAMRVRQILANYLSNALKFTERGYVTLKMAATSLPSGRTRIRYEVADTGCGIAEENVPRLFEKFPDLDAETARQHKGAGLGLSICREIATLMGAKVGAESVLGVGSVFALEIECEQGSIEHAVPESSSAGGVIEVPEARPVRVLVAEDHPVNQKLFQAVLGHMGCEVHLVGNGREAVEAVAREHFDIVLLDANMPVMDGSEAARQIRALGEKGTRLPLVAVTADAMVGDRERFLAQGMDDYLTKPIDAQALTRIIERYTRGGSWPEEPRTGERQIRNAG